MQCIVSIGRLLGVSDSAGSLSSAVGHQALILRPMHSDLPDLAAIDLVNAESLTTPTLSRVFLGSFFCFSLDSRSLRRRRTNCIFFCCFRSSVSPSLSRARLRSSTHFCPPHISS